jgi:alpha-tubulin suppressor-like RCC1 family protein
VAVAGGLTFTAISVGIVHTCALTVDGIAYCWGQNVGGSLGVGETTGPELCRWYSNDIPCSKVPVPVATTLRWAGISAFSQTCAVALGGAAYCWGYNWDGMLGTGTTTDATVPEPVVGGLTFASVSAGGGKTCGVTTDGIAYCWGYNGKGALGDGTTTNSPVPVKVAGQQ